MRVGFADRGPPWTPSSLAELSAARLASARARFERLGIVDAEGKLVSTELPPDMLPDSDTTLETG